MAAAVPSVVAANVAGCSRQVVTWTPMNTTDRSGAAYDIGNLNVVSIQFTGTFSAGSPIMALEGSNDGTNWFSLPNAAGTAIALTAVGGAGVSVQARYVRPTLAGGDGSSAIGAVLLLRRVL